MEETRHNKIDSKKIIYKYDVMNPKGVCVWTIYANRIDIITEMTNILKIQYESYIAMFDSIPEYQPRIRYMYPPDGSWHTIYFFIKIDEWTLIRNDVKPINYSNPKTIGIFGGTGILDENHPDW